METFKEMISETRDVLNYLYEYNNTTTLFNQAGFCARWEEAFRKDSNPNDKSVQDLIDRDFANIDAIDLRSLYEFGFTVGGHYSEEYKKRFDVRCLMLDDSSVPVKDQLIRKLMSIKDMLDRACMNIIILYIPNEEVFSCFESYSLYTEDIFNIVTQFKEANKNINMSFYESDLSAECTSYSYKYRTAIRNAKSIDHLIPIDSQDKLNKLCKFMNVNSKVFIDSHKTSTLSDIDIMCIAYSALRNKCVFLTDSGSWDTKFILYVKSLFSGDWSSASFIAHVNKLSKGYYILNKGSDNLLCTDVEVHDRYTVNCMPIKHALSGVDDTILRHIVKAEKCVVPSADFLHPDTVLSAMMDLVGGNAEQLTTLISRIHTMALYHLTDKLIGFCNISWVVHNNEMCFCVVDDLLQDTLVNVISDGAYIQKKCRYKDLLPLPIFELSFFKSIDAEKFITQDMLDICTCKEYSFNFLKSFIGSKDRLMFSSLCAEGKFDEAMLSVYNTKISHAEEAYRLTISTFGKEFVDKLAISLTGNFSPNFRLGSLV